MNPTWDLLPFQQLCRMLSRKTGEPAEKYNILPRGKVKELLDEYEGSDSVLVKEVHTVNEEQLQKLQDSIAATFIAKRYEDKQVLDSRFDDLRHEILSAIRASRQVTREVVVIDKRFEETERKLGRQHMDFKVLLSLVATGQNVLLVGPAGSGKTQAAMNVAKALGVPFYFNGAIDNEYKLLGFTDAQGKIVSRPFREAWCNGGLYLFDELDGSMPAAVLAFNAPLGNGICDFPDMCVPRHKDFYCLAAANTFFGADHQYVGRMKQDAAALDRFLVLDWHYDQDLELQLALDLWPANPVRAKEWFNMVIKVRQEAADKGMQIVISPRATLGGVKLLRTDVAWNTAVRVTIRKTMKNEDWQKIESATREYVPPQPKAAEESPYMESLDKRVSPNETYNEYYHRTQREREEREQKNFKVKSHGKTHKKFIQDLI